MTAKRSVNSMVNGLQASAAQSGLGRIHRLAHSTDSPVGGARPGVAANEPGFLVFEPGMTYPVGARVILPLELLIEHPLNPRVFFDEDDMQELMSSIVRSGLQTAIQVYPVENGRFKLKSGHRRVRAFRRLGYLAIKVEIVAHSGDEMKDYREAREINKAHRSHSHFDDAVRFKELLEMGTVSDQQKLADALGITDAEVSKHLSIGALPRPALVEMAQNLTRFGLTASYLLYRCWTSSGNDDAALMKLIARVAEGKLSTRQLERLVQEQKQPQNAGPRRALAFSRAEVKGFGTGELKTYKGKLVLELKALPDEKRDQLFARILKLFKDEGLEVGSAMGEA